MLHSILAWLKTNGFFKYTFKALSKHPHIVLEIVPSQPAGSNQQISELNSNPYTDKITRSNLGTFVLRIRSDIPASPVRPTSQNKTPPIPVAGIQIPTLKS